MIILTIILILNITNKRKISNNILLVLDKRGFIQLSEIST